MQVAALLVVMREHADDGHGHDEEGHHGFAEELGVRTTRAARTAGQRCALTRPAFEPLLGQLEMPPLEEIATILTMCLTMASSSDFVRSHGAPRLPAPAQTDTCLSPPTEPSLGTLIRIGQDFLFSGEWWILLFPAATLLALALSVNLLGDWLRDILNPRLK